ncbi:MAG: BrnT family toxin, partial [Polyangiaceae bacterium]|nr:BrnT family toxin [Polyangiaceae bacterium]
PARLASCCWRRLRVRLTQRHLVPTGAPTCFDDPNGCYFRNESPSYKNRLILIAMSARSHVLFVVHAEVGRDSIRIVSARRASPAQRRLYDGLER